MKKVFEIPELTVEFFDPSDVIATSGIAVAPSPAPFTGEEDTF